MADVGIREAADRVLVGLRDAGRHEETVRHYQAVLDQFAVFLARRGVDSASELVCIDFIESEVRAWKGEAEEPYVYKADVDRRLIEALLERHVEDWVNSLFLSSRFVGHRPDPSNFNEFVMTFFKALSSERISYVERSYRERREQADEFFERDGWRIERFCPHRQADLTRFGEIADGLLTCSLHHWQFDLATGRCLTSDDRHLRCERVEESKR